MDTTQRPRRDFAALGARCLEAAKLFAQGRPQAEIVRRLKVSRLTTHRWYQACRRHGRQGLKGVGRAAQAAECIVTHSEMFGLVWDVRKLSRFMPHQA